MGSDLRMANVDSVMQQSQVQSAVQMKVFQTSLDDQSKAVQELLQMAPKAANPPHLGQNLDISI